MDYNKIYLRLIERAKSRVLKEYGEQHHIIPKCIGGIDEKDNLVKLTPEEHFVAHQLLVKIYPDNEKLVHAACMMTLSNQFVVRNNKLYGWLRRKLSKSAKSRVGNKNSSYGRLWYHDPTTLENGKFSLQDVPQGWVIGRKPKVKCLTCKSETPSRTSKYCNLCRPKKSKFIFKKEKVKDFYSDEEKINALTIYNGNIRQALFSLGLNDSGENYRMIKKLNATVYPHATNV